MAQYLSQIRDGFQLTTNRFELPEGILTIDPLTKRDIEICHLFLNRRLGVADIVWLLGEDNGTVVLALLEQGIIQERRRQPRPVPQENERRKSITGLRATEIYARLRS
jgi:hypothetical protein